MLSKIKKAYQRGLYASARIAEHRMRKWYFVRSWRTSMHAYVPACPQETNKTLSFVHALCTKSDHTPCIAQADEFVAGYIAVLGSEKKIYERVPWHTDIRLQQQSPDADASFSADTFFADITIEAGKDPQAFAKDIKVPWELGRLQELPILGHAYMVTKNERYAKKIIDRVVEWIDANPFLLGVNWCNPMEVGLRAVSSIIAMSMIVKSASITSSFCEKVAISLQEHKTFITNNFEWYDGRTSNHYLSDLVGYLYLCWFFDDDIDWVVRELVLELDKQILPDGMSYEGSTTYHALVTELIHYAQLLVDHEYPQYKNVFAKKYKQMHEALWWCTPHNGSVITVGDDDSGRIALFDWYASSHAMENKSIFLPDFGLSVYKSGKVHCTLRHHAYTARQPSGHFHNDVGSMTLAVDGHPIIIDPGSFVYTPSVYWRNYFRSAAVHNSVSIVGHEPVDLTDQLFYLALPEHQQKGSLFLATHMIDQTLLLQHDRFVTCSDTQIELYDTWHVLKPLQETVRWNFMLHPDVVPRAKNLAIELWVRDRLIATIQSPDLDFTIEQSFCALGYGIKKPTNCIRAYAPCDTMKARITIIIAL